jgi:hypothetical protein
VIAGKDGRWELLKALLLDDFTYSFYSTLLYCYLAGVIAGFFFSFKLEALYLHTSKYLLRLSFVNILLLDRLLWGLIHCLQSTLQSTWIEM